MRERFIPNADEAFSTMSSNFANVVNRDPDVLGISPDLARELSAAVGHFCASFRATKTGASSGEKIRIKKAARADAERLIKRCARIIRMREDLPAGTLFNLGMKELSPRKRRRQCPQQPPVLRFVGATLKGNAARPVHELRFKAAGVVESNAKPEGATRVELVAHLVPLGQPIPAHPDDARPLDPGYLRSFSKNPIRVKPEMSRTPAMVVYWGRWANETGAYGDWSATVVSRVECWTDAMMLIASFGKKRPAPVLEDASPAATEHYSVSVRDEQYEFPHQREIAGITPTKLEGPAEEKEAA